MTPATAAKRGQGKRGAQTTAEGRQNGHVPDPLAEAMEHEAKIAAEAEEIRREAKVLTPLLLLDLLPLLRRKIPAGLIVSTPAVKGKPYASTGVKSLQVLIDRMDNVLTPLWWSYEVEYVGPDGFDQQGHPNRGKLAIATVYVGPREEPLFTRTSYGGVNQASTAGNLFKGSETNAAKRAIAAVGPAHEVYIGATDFDPDTDPDAAKAQEQKADAGEKDPQRPLSPAAIEKLRAAIGEKALTEQDVSNKLRAFGVESFEKLTADQGVGFWEWLNGADATEKS